MPALVSMLFGSVLLLGGCLWLWYLTTKPQQWSAFLDREHAFCIRWGAPTWLSKPVKVIEKGAVMKGIVVLLISGGALLTAEPVLLALILTPHHG